jgi:RNA polymerase sigma factor (sigma-70 family)
MTVALDWEDELPSLRSNCASPESLLIQKSNIAAIRDAIEQLPFPYREVILLCDVEGLAYREIAEILEIPIGTVMSRLARARKVVRDALRPTQTEHYRQPTSALEEAGRQTSCAHQQHLYV